MIPILWVTLKICLEKFKIRGLHTLPPWLFILIIVYSRHSWFDVVNWGGLLCIPVIIDIDKGLQYWSLVKPKDIPLLFPDGHKGASKKAI